MKVLVTRVSKGRVKVEGQTISSIERGLAVFAGIEQNDGLEDLEKMAGKVVNLRIFENEQGKFHYSVLDQNLAILCVSNFTLCADTEKGRRPSFEKAMPLDKAGAMFEQFVSFLCARGVIVYTGEFGAHMDIELEMDGPVNIVLSS